MKSHSRYAVSRRLLLFDCLFIGLGAESGSVGKLTAPDGSNLGMQALLPYFQVLPFAEVLFQDYVFSGVALLCVNGLTNLTAAVLLLKKKRLGVILGGIFGVTLMAWITIQFVIFPANVLSISYFIFGAIQAAAGFAAWVFEGQERFAASPADYPHIGENPNRLVVYFSRMGYVRREACEVADRTGAALYEVKATERTEGTPGFWWCGRFGMHGWPMPIEQTLPDLSAYEHVTVCSPIWVFRLSGPMRAFCMAAAGKVREADYVLVHFQRARYENAAAEMDRLLGLSGTPTVSVCCRWGRVLRRETLRRNG